MNQARRPGRRGPGHGRLDRSGPAHPAPRSRSSQGPRSRPSGSWRPSRSPTSRRWRRSGPVVDAVVEDPDTAQKLKAWYRQLCKRPCFHDEYLQAYNRPNVTLVDTDGKGVERITRTGVVVAGVEYEVDCIIFASGFEVGTEFSRAGRQRPGRAGGRRLSRALGRRDANLARHAGARLPEPVPHPARPRCRTSSRTCPTTSPRSRRAVAAVVRHAVERRPRRRRGHPGSRGRVDGR